MRQLVCKVKITFNINLFEIEQIDVKEKLFAFSAFHHLDNIVKGKANIHRDKVGQR